MSGSKPRSGWSDRRETDSDSSPGGITTTLEEWNSSRNADYDELYKDPAIPPNLIAAVKGFRYNAPVRWVTKDGHSAPPIAKFAIPIVEPRQKNFQLEEIFGSGKDQIVLDEPFPKTAREALAMCLRGRLAALRKAGSAPVRSRKMVSSSAIARVAVDMLGDGHLPDLIGELLEVDRRKAKGDQKFVERGKAIWIKAQAKEIGVRELAEMVGVNPSTVTRWMQESEFQREIRDTRSTIEIMKKQGIWPSNKVAETRAGDISDAVGKVSSSCDKETKSGLITESKKRSKAARR
jgi:DNA-binding transcriptional regulator YhcF (GntR family)